MADTSLIFNILARGGEKTAAELIAVGAAADHVATKTSKLRKISFGPLTSGLKGVSKVTLTAAKGLLAVGVAASAMNTAIQAGTALAPLTGLLALLPGVALGAAAAMGTLKLAFSGFSDAFAAIKTGDQEKFDKALDAMGPAARRVAKELMALRPAFVGLRNTAQAAVFTPLQGQLTAVAKTLMGPLRVGVAQVGHEFGLAGRSVAEFARQSATVAVLRKAFSTVAQSIHKITPALQPVLAGFRGLAGVGLGFLPGIASSVSTVAQRFGVWLQKMVASGKAAQWIKNALATLKQLGGILSNVGGILKSVFSAASAAGSGFLGVIGQALGQLNAFLKTGAGKSALISIFQALAAIGRSLAPVIAAIVTGLGTLAAPLGRLAQLIGPLLTTAVKALAPAFAALEPGLAAVFGALGSVITILAPALMPLATAISQIAVALAPVLPLLAVFVAQLVTALAPILSDLVGALAPLISAIVQLAGAFVPLIPPIATLIVQLVQGLVPALLPLVPVLTQLVQVVGNFLVQALGILLRALIPLLPTIVNLAVVFVQQLLPVAIQLAPALLNILTALMPLLPALVNLAPPILQILLASTPLVAILLELAAVILEKVLPPVVKLADFLLRVLGGALNFIATVATKITSAVVGVFQWLYNKLIGHSIIPDLVNGILRWFGSLPGKVAELFARVAKGAADKMVGLIKWMGGVPGALLRALGKTGSILYQAGKNVVQGLINGIWAKAKALWNTMSQIVKGIRNMWPFSPAKTGPLSGGGSPDIAGHNIASMLAEGMHKGSGVVMAASARLAGAAQPNVTPVGAGSAGASARDAAGAGQRNVIELHSDGTKLGRLLIELIREGVRDRGGNVQIVLGG